MGRRHCHLVCLQVLVAVATLVSAAVGKADSAPRCEALFRKSEKPYNANLQPTFKEAAKSLLQYSQTIKSQFLERDFVFDSFLRCLLSDEHLLLIGEPGSGKTGLSKTFLSNIVDARTGLSNYYAMQMHKEISYTDTYGSINYKIQNEEGRIVRNYYEGMVDADYAFVDEIFDIRAGALRNKLEVLEERSHSQGTLHHKGKLKLAIGASNKYLSEVYRDHDIREDGNAEGPTALLNRFSEILYVSADMDKVSSSTKVFLKDKGTPVAIRQITLQEIAVLQEAMLKVKIPEYIAALAGHIQYQLKPILQGAEARSIDEFIENRQNGEFAMPPRRATKLLNIRTNGKAGTFLRATVVLDYIRKKGQRSLVATTADLEQLKHLFRIGGPEQEVLDREYVQAVKKPHREQLQQMKAERAVIDPLITDTIKGFNEALAALRPQDIDSMVRDVLDAKAPSREDKLRLVELLKGVYKQAELNRSIELHSLVTVQTIASGAMGDLVGQQLEKLYPGRSAKIMAAWKAEKTPEIVPEIVPEKPPEIVPEKPPERPIEKSPEKPNSSSAGSVLGIKKTYEFSAPGGAKEILADFDFAPRGGVVRLGRSTTLEFWRRKGKRWDSGTREATLGQYTNFVKTLGETVVVGSPGKLEYFNLNAKKDDEKYAGIDHAASVEKTIAPDARKMSRFYLMSSQSIESFILEKGKPAIVDQRLNSGTWSLSDYDSIADVFVQWDTDSQKFSIFENPFLKKSVATVTQLNEKRWFDVDKSSSSMVVLNGTHVLFNVKVKNDFRFGMIDLQERHHKSFEIFASEPVRHIAISPDRKLVAITYEKKIEIHLAAEIHAVFAQAKALSSPVETIEISNSSVVATKFSDQSDRLLVKTERGFVEYSISQNPIKK